VKNYSEMDLNAIFGTALRVKSDAVVQSSSAHAARKRFFFFLFLWRRTDEEVE
jgi:hypothetical protein